MNPTSLANMFRNNSEHVCVCVFGQAHILNFTFLKSDMQILYKRHKTSTSTHSTDLLLWFSLPEGEVAASEDACCVTCVLASPASEPLTCCSWSVLVLSSLPEPEIRIIYNFQLHTHTHTQSCNTQKTKIKADKHLQAATHLKPHSLLQIANVLFWQHNL